MAHIPGKRDYADAEKRTGEKRKQRGYSPSGSSHLPFIWTACFSQTIGRNHVNASFSDLLQHSQHEHRQNKRPPMPGGVARSVVSNGVYCFASFSHASWCPRGGGTCI